MELCRRDSTMSKMVSWPFVRHFSGVKKVCPPEGREMRSMDDSVWGKRVAEKSVTIGSKIIVFFGFGPRRLRSFGEEF